MTNKLQRHLRQAGHNADVATVLSRAESPISCQWAVVCLFYAGVHYVNAYLCLVSKDEIPQAHGARVNCVRKHMGSILKQFERLKFESERARYHMKYPRKKHVEDLQEKLADIQQFVLRELPPGQVH